MNNIHDLNPNGNGNKGRQPIPVSPDDLTPVSCPNPECDGNIFQRAHQTYKLSAVHPKNPTNKAQIVNVPVNICLACGTVSSDQELGEG